MKNSRNPLIHTLGMFAALLFIAPHSASAAHFSSFEPAPKGLVLVARPTIYWPLFLGPDTAIKEISLTLNGVRQAMAYDPTRQVCVAIVDKPLAEGDYVGRISVSFVDGAKYDKVWQFSVSPDAVPDYPAPDSAQQAAIDAVNGIRRHCGLLDAQLNTSLCAAAEAHCRYMKLNGAYSHLESRQRLGFTGVAPEDRVAAWGYPLGDYEDISSETTSMDKMVQGLMNAPYHRAAFLQPGAPDFGFSGEGGKSTLEFGIPDVEGVTVYPTDGQTGVPTSWSDDESPDPLRIHPGAGKEVGYPITLFYYGAADSAISVTLATLTAADGADVPVYVNRDANDMDLQAGVILFPQAPLADDTRYTAKISGTTLAGKDISHVWSFTTEAADAK